MRTRTRSSRWHHGPNGWHRPSGMDWIRRSTRCAIYARDGDRCLVCGSAAELSLDHIDPQGSNAPENLLTVCVSCNSQRGKRPLELVLGAELAAELRAHAQRPIDRALGLARARALYPARFAAEAARRKRLASGLS